MGRPPTENKPFFHVHKTSAKSSAPPVLKDIQLPLSNSQNFEEYMLHLGLEPHTSTKHKTLCYKSRDTYVTHEQKYSSSLSKDLVIFLVILFVYMAKVFQSKSNGWL